MILVMPLIWEQSPRITNIRIQLNAIHYILIILRLQRNDNFVKSLVRNLHLYLIDAVIVKAGMETILLMNIYLEYVIEIGG